jgi:hypothetical protein
VLGSKDQKGGQTGKRQSQGYSDGQGCRSTHPERSSGPIFHKGAFCLRTIFHQALLQPEPDGGPFAIVY